MAVNHQVERSAIKERAGMLDLLGIGTLQHPQISVVSHVFGGLAIAQTRAKKAHQLAIIMFHNGTWRLPAGQYALH